MDNTNLLLEALSLPHTALPHLKALRVVVNSNVSSDINTRAQQSLIAIIHDYNTKVAEMKLSESCVVKPTDTTKTIRKRCKKAFRHGLKHYPMRYVYAVANSPLASGLSEENNPYDSPDTSIKTFTGQLGKDTRKIKKPLTLKLVDPESGLERDADEYGIAEADTSTERVRRYYKRHPKKVTQYLRKTAKDRAARNRDRAKAVKKYGKSKMKNHDVHHPNGARNGNWKLADKDHGRDTKAMKKAKKKPVTRKEPKKREKKVAAKPTLTPVQMKVGIQVLDKLVKLFIELLVYLQKIGQLKQSDTTSPTNPLKSKDMTLAEIKTLIGNPVAMHVSAHNVEHRLEVLNKTMTKLHLHDAMSLSEISTNFGHHEQLQSKVFQLIEQLLLESATQLFNNSKVLLEQKNSTAVPQIQRVIESMTLHINPARTIITEQEDTKQLKLYPHVRDYTDEELQNELEEYFQNEKTKDIFPNLATSEDTLRALVKEAPTVTLTMDELLELKNSDVQEVLVSENPKEAAKQVAMRHKKDVDSLKSALKDGKELPMPIVIKYKGGQYLMAGNTRLILLAGSGLTMPVKQITYPEEPNFGQNDNDADKKKEQSRKKIDTGLFKKILQMRIRNPETGNMIKIDSAMDYERHHPAHRLALSMIRHYMKGVSTRAGVAKQDKQ